MTEIRIGTLDEFPAEDYRILAVGAFEFGVFHYDGRLVAWENNCPHFNGPACQGRVFHKVGETILADGSSGGLAFEKIRQVICPWHGYEFNLETGRHPGDPRMRLREVPLAIRGDVVFAQLPA